MTVRQKSADGLAATKMLRPEHAVHLAGFLIPTEILDAAGLQSVSDAETREMLGLHGLHGADLGGILFPYLSPVTGARVGGRIRLDHLLPDGGKYISEPGCRHLFFPPICGSALADASIPVVIVEAEKSALALTALAGRAGRKLLPIATGGCWGWRRKIGNRPLPNGGAEPETGPSPDLDLVAWENRPVILAFDSNAATNSKVRSARRALAEELIGRGANVSIADVPAEPGINGPDDLIAITGDEAALRVLAAARLFATCAVAEAEQAVAALESDKKSNPFPAIEAIAVIEDPMHRALLIARLAAIKVPGVSRKFVEQKVRGHRAEAETNQKKTVDACRQGRLMAMAVEGAPLLDEICAFIRRFVFLSDPQACIAALWTAHTHAFDAAECTPYLAVTSPEKRSGKSRLLEVLNTLVENPWLTGRVTAAVLYRKVDAESPTLLLDEIDAAFASGEEYGEALRGILNAGHRRGGKTTCCVKQGGEVAYQDFSTFSPKAIAGIGKLPDTIADRSIPLSLKRKMRSDEIERFRLRNVKVDAERLRESLKAWGCQSVERLRDARPALPEELSDRQQDGAEPLLAIAELAGDEWAKAARQALVSLCTGVQAADDSIGALLLSDIRQIFKAKSTDRLTSAELARELAEVETSPWAEWKQGKSITPIGVARLLKPFGIAPHSIREGTAVLRGYEINDFGDAWARYLAPEGVSAVHTTGSRNATTLQPNTGAGLSAFQTATAHEGVAAQKREIVNKTGACSGVAVAESHIRASSKSSAEPALFTPEDEVAL